MENTMRVCLECSWKITELLEFKLSDWSILFQLSWLGISKNQIGCEEKLQVVVGKGFQVTPEHFIWFSPISYIVTKTIYSFKYFRFYNLSYLKMNWYNHWLQYKNNFSKLQRKSKCLIGLGKLIYA